MRVWKIARLGGVHLITALVLAACAGAPASESANATPTDEVPSPGASVEPTAAAPTPSPNSEPPAPTSPTPPSSEADLIFLASTVDGLRMRIGPDIEAPGMVFQCNSSAACSDPVVIDADWKMLALAGPVANSGYEWYLVKLDAEHPGSAHLGWAATPQSGDPWLVAAEYECPAAPLDLDTAIALGAVPLLYCYGDQPLTFDGYVVDGFGCGGTGTYEPLWLAHPCANMSYISPVAATDGDGRLFLHYPAPGVINPTLDLEAAQHVRITGHYDDPAAQGCSILPDDEPQIAMTAGDAIADVAVCRLRFVVTEVVADPSG